MDLLDLYAFSMMNTRIIHDEKERLEEENAQIIDKDSYRETINENNKKINKMNFELKVLAYIGMYIQDFYSLLDIDGFDFTIEELCEKLGEMEKKILEESFGKNLIKSKEE